MKEDFNLFFCQKFCIIFVTDFFLLQNARAGYWVYSKANLLTCLVVTVLDSPPLPPNPRMSGFVFLPIVI